MRRRKQPAEPAADKARVLEVDRGGAFLVVDDDELARVALRKMLAPHGEVITVADGDGARAVVAQKRLLRGAVVDWKLGREDGVELATWVREQCDVPVMLVTGYCDEPPRELWDTEGVMFGAKPDLSPAVGRFVTVTDPKRRRRRRLARVRVAAQALAAECRLCKSEWTILLAAVEHDGVFGETFPTVRRAKESGGRPYSESTFKNQINTLLAKTRAETGAADLRELVLYLRVCV